MQKSPGFFSPESDTAQYMSQPAINRPPVKLMLSLIGACNLDCLHCSGPQKDLTTPSLAMIEWIMQNLMPSVRAIRLGGNDNTEQLLSPMLLYFLDRVADFEPIQHFDLVTNLSVMSPELAQVLAQQLTRIEVSLEGTEQNYERIRGSSWDRFVANLKTLNDGRTAVGDSRLKLNLLVCSMLSCIEDVLQVERFQDLGIDRMVLREFNPHNKAGHAENKLQNDPERVYRFIEMFKERCDKVGMRYQINYENKFKPQPIKVGAAAAVKPAYANPRIPRDCHQPWEIISISHSGELSACCRYPFWNQPEFETQSLDAVWNSANFRELRKTVNTDDLQPACERCEFKHSG